MAVGGTGIWAMHFVAMLGYTIPGQEILYNVTMTVISLVAAISVVAVYLFIVGFGGGGSGPVLAGGVIMGVGVCPGSRRAACCSRCCSGRAWSRSCSC